MDYTKTAWVDNSTPPISAANLNKLEAAVYDSAEGMNKVRATSLTCGYMDWSTPTTFPDATYGYCGCSAAAYATESALSVLAAIPSIKRTLVYKSFHEIESIGGSPAANAEDAVECDPLSSAASYELLNSLIGTTAFMKHSGSDIVDGFGKRVANLSHTDLQEFQLEAVKAGFDRLGASSIFCDTYGDAVAPLGGIGYLPDGVISENDWENRFVKPHRQVVLAGLRAQGIWVVTNGSGESSAAASAVGPGGYHHENQNNGGSRLRWLMDMAPYIDGMSHEFAFQNGGDNSPLDDSIAVTGSAVHGSNSWWRYWLRVVELCGKLGKGYYGVVYPYNSGQSFRFARYSALLAWDGVHELAIFDFSGSGSLADTSPSWKAPTGYPIARRRQTATGSYTWTRQYQLGTVIVNSDPTTTHNVSGHSVPARDAVFITGEWF